MRNLSRRSFLDRAAVAAVGTAFGYDVLARAAAAGDSSGMRFGLVTYLWGKDMDLPTLIKVCERSGMAGVETRTQHKHGVEPSLSAVERREVRRRFDDSPVRLVGYGSNAQYHEADPAKVRANIELTKKYIHLMHDCGGSGVKVKPNGFPKDVSREKTIEQIGRALNRVAAYGADYGQQIRVEAHGRGTSELPVMKAIFDVADHPNATICWNCNGVDTEGEGLQHNFNLVKSRLGATVHVHDLTEDKYPYSAFLKLLIKMGYQGWILLEAGGNPTDKVRALVEQRKAFEALTK